MCHIRLTHPIEDRRAPSGLAARVMFEVQDLDGLAARVMFGVQDLDGLAPPFSLLDSVAHNAGAGTDHRHDGTDRVGVVEEDRREYDRGPLADYDGKPLAYHIADP